MQFQRVFTPLEYLPYAGTLLSSDLVSALNEEESVARLYCKPRKHIPCLQRFSPLHTARSPPDFVIRTGRSKESVSLIPTDNTPHHSSSTVLASTRPLSNLTQLHLQPFHLDSTSWINHLRNPTQLHHCPTYKIDATTTYHALPMRPLLARLK